MLCSCLLQEPAPVSLRGEEFYGDRERDEGGEYRLTRDSTSTEMMAKTQRRLKRKLLVRSITTPNPKRDTPAAETEHTQEIETEASLKKVCAFDMPLTKSRVVRRQSRTDGTPYCSSGVAMFSDGVAEVMAAASGRVMYVGKGLKWHGSLVILEHNRYTISLYSYLHDVRVKAGDNVEKGQIIATIAGPGGDREYFFCFSIRHNGKPIDPIRYIDRCRKSDDS
ncbi:MAG: murein hydrolase activator EnvC family protein [Anaplasma sp.]